MRIAILGATSQIAKDLIRSFDEHGGHKLTLHARRPAAVLDWLNATGGPRHAVRELSALNDASRFDAVINFVGVANPEATVSLGAEILNITASVDELAMTYLARRPDCRYVFLSSGAAYCSPFEEPAREDTRCEIELNRLQPQDWYGLAKLTAECRHRASSQFSIVDLRVFSYFSRTQDMSARFLVTDMLRAIRDRTVLQTSAAQNVRDYLHPADFHALVSAVLAHAPVNTALDCYTCAPVEKWALLEAMREQFGLRFEVTRASAAVNATGSKPNYYSLDRRAAAFGYAPSLSSVDGVALEVQSCLASGTGLDPAR